MFHFYRVKLWRSLGIVNFIWVLGILGFGQAFFIVRLLSAHYFGHRIDEMHLYLDLGISLVCGAVWGLAMWYLLINEKPVLDGTSRSSPN